MSIIQIRNSSLAASVSTLGAEQQSLTRDGLEYIWQGDPAYWAKRAPFLFPHVGVLKDGVAVHRDGKTYTLGNHGFAKDMEFTPVNCRNDHAEFVLEANNETLAVYPYPFRFKISYALSGSALRVSMEVINTGNSPLPFGMGGHTAFRIPLKAANQFSDYSITFEKKEHQSCPLYKDKVLHVDKTRLMLNNTNVLPLRYEDFKDDALMFEGLKSSALELAVPGSKNGIHFRWKGFSMLGIWTPPNKNAPFLCLEPWTSGPGRSDEDSVFDKKHNILLLKPGESYTAWYEIEPMR
ncbi:MAG: aldose 1-epimerase family protein [Treponema sp.]|nr:aldose 1-epimerase family protein [Treponema sp.]